jgi:hypothetical protein
LCDSDEYLVFNCPFNPKKNPHNNIKHIVEQFNKYNVSLHEISNIELYHDSDSDNDSNKVEIKGINMNETENKIQKINIYEIDTTLDSNNYNNQHLDNKIIN